MVSKDQSQDDKTDDEIKSLADFLLKKKLISEAQLELAVADQEISDLPLEEILIVRGWINKEILQEAAPWLELNETNKAKIVEAPILETKSTKEDSKSTSTSSDQVQNKKPNNLKTPPLRSGNQAVVHTSPLESDFDENQKKYDKLIKKITENNSN